MVSIIIKFCHAVRVVSFFVNLSVQSREDEILRTAKTLRKTVEVRPKLRAVSIDGCFKQVPRLQNSGPALCKL